jgi:hypothetical protein
MVAARSSILSIHLTGIRSYQSVATESAKAIAGEDDRLCFGYDLVNPWVGTGEDFYGKLRQSAAAAHVAYPAHSADCRICNLRVFNKRDCRRPILIAHFAVRVGNHEPQHRRPSPHNLVILTLTLREGWRSRSPPLPAPCRNLVKPPPCGKTPQPIESITPKMCKTFCRSPLPIC